MGIADITRPRRAVQRSSSSSRENVTVAVRIRPPPPGEEDQRAWNVVRADGEEEAKDSRDRCANATIQRIASETAEVEKIRRGTPSQKKRPDPKHTFDYVFDDEDDTGDVYSCLAWPLVQGACEGYHSTIFAYGQTGSGKTYTMYGTDSYTGVFHYAVKDVFEIINQTTEREFLVRLQCFEIYNEVLYDLLFEGSHPPAPKIQHDRSGNVILKNISEEVVRRAEDVFTLVGRAQARRHTGSTAMNERSSRSHLIARIVIESTEVDGGGKFRESHFNLVDLAGSECAKKTQAEGKRLREGGEINKSLSALARVIQSLTGNSPEVRIPYRDTKLTTILEPSLGGNSKTAVVCTISSVLSNAEETRRTLQFAKDVKAVVNTARINERQDERATMQMYRAEVEDLKRQIEILHEQLATPQPSAQQIASARREYSEELGALRAQLHLKEERIRHLASCIIRGQGPQKRGVSALCDSPRQAKRQRTNASAEEMSLALSPRGSCMIGGKGVNGAHMSLLAQDPPEIGGDVREDEKAVLQRGRLLLAMVRAVMHEASAAPLAGQRRPLQRSSGAACAVQKENITAIAAARANEAELQRAVDDAAQERELAHERIKVLEDQVASLTATLAETAASKGEDAVASLARSLRQQTDRNKELERELAVLRVEHRASERRAATLIKRSAVSLDGAKTAGEAIRALEGLLKRSLC